MCACVFLDKEAVGLCELDVAVSERKVCAGYPMRSKIWSES